MYFSRRNKDNFKLNKGRGFSLLAVIMAAILVFSACADANKGNNDNGKEQAQSKNVPKKEYNIPPASAENDLLKIATTVHGTDEKVCYLTFDDGPTKEVTPRVLDVLKQYDVKATFFVLGNMLDRNRDIGKRVAEEGHLLANHSYYHQYKELYASADSFMAEIERTQNLIKEVTGEDYLPLVRFPGGGHNAGPYAAVKQEYKNVLKEKGYYFADWNCLNGDAEAALRSPGELLARTRETAVGKNIIVLMHDAAAKVTTPDALGSIIEYLRSQGYVFKRLDEVEYYDKSSKQEENTDMVL